MTTPLEMHRGDERELRVAMTLENEEGVPEAWTPPPGTTLRCTGKLKLSDSDANALFAKETGDGITVDGSEAMVTIAPADTTSLTGAKTPVYCDVQAAHADWGPYTVAEFQINVTADITRTAP